LGCKPPPDRFISSHSPTVLLNAPTVDDFPQEAFVPNSRREYNRRRRLSSTQARNAHDAAALRRINPIRWAIDDAAFFDID
jgi:hypothetical protein